jgi:hypothetical protein
MGIMNLFESIGVGQGLRRIQYGSGNVGLGTALIWTKSRLDNLLERLVSLEVLCSFLSLVRLPLRDYFDAMEV